MLKKHTIFGWDRSVEKIKIHTNKTAVFSSHEEDGVQFSGPVFNRDIDKL